MDSITVFGRVIHLTKTGYNGRKSYVNHVAINECRSFSAIPDTADGYGPYLRGFYEPPEVSFTGKDYWYVLASLKPQQREVSGSGASPEEAEANLRKNLNEALASWNALKAELG